MFKKAALIGILIFSFYSYGFCITQEQTDRFNTFNRASFALNEKLDRCIFQKVARTYLKVTPKPVQRGVHHAFNNFRELPSVTNDLLQGNWYQALNDGWRFFFNSVFGIAGILDVAKPMGLEPHYTDLGITLALWGYEPSSYLVLPLLGPSTVRDALSYPLDGYAGSVYPLFPLIARVGLMGLNAIDTRAQLLQYQGLINQISLDAYVFQRDAYLQHREQEVQQARESKNWKEQAAAFNQTRKANLLPLYVYQYNSASPLF